jgi:hypothetical protein
MIFGGMMKGAICFRAVIIVGMMITLGACADGWSTSQVSPQAAAAGRAPTPVDQIQIMEGDVTDRPYKSLGDVSVTVNKTTLFNADPTREMVNQRLRTQAAKLGADAVIQVRYGTVGISALSWGSLDGKGRAIAYEKQ